MKILTLFAAVVVCFFAGACTRSAHRHAVITVTKTDRVCEHSGSCRYVVFTTDTTYENVDAPFENKRESSDIQGHLLPGHTYEVEVVGRRNPSWSAYPNILRVLGERGTPVPIVYGGR